MTTTSPVPSLKQHPVLLLASHPNTVRSGRGLLQLFFRLDPLSIGSDPSKRYAWSKAHQAIVNTLVNPYDKRHYRFARLKLLQIVEDRRSLPAFLALSDNGTVVPVVSKCENR